MLSSRLQSPVTSRRARRVVVLGSSFAGLTGALELRKQKSLAAAK